MIFSLVKRNLKLYFRDKTSVFFSLLGVFIIIGLYVIFLGKMMVSYTESVIPENAKFMMTSWIMAGVISVTTVTTCNGAFGIMVEDTALNKLRDFKVSPIKRWQLVLSYIISSMIVGIIMSLLTFVASEVYIYLEGGSIVSFTAFIKIIGMIFLSVFSSSAMVFLIISFIKSQNAFGTASSIIGTLVGFLTGIYIPVGNLPIGVQTVIKIFPLSHSGVLLRQIMMQEAVDLAYVPEEFKLFLGVNFEVNGSILSSFLHIAYLLVSGVLFYILAIIVVSKKRSK
ncbi:MAG: ABC transporter permease [Candidatus Izemoplasmatales bacterium]|nr:ABC transporter permease [Candidatus Izemoplasmatales bacterium]MDD4070392.1 ABC transporter permease [Candidatus Izemoplasmatales bacterium]MDY0139250.1 ABC transporter permease [Candidatus Izemoplasmatales bacterium]